jgi:prolyl 4-hydroxylase
LFAIVPHKLSSSQLPLSCFIASPSNPLLRFQELIQAADMGVPQTLESKETYGMGVEEVAPRIESSRKYLKTVDLPTDLKELCRNENELCTIWALVGECDKNPTYMKKSCAPACQSCDYLFIESRCPLDPDAPDAWGPGDLDEMFRRLSSEPYLSEYDVQVLSSPDSTEAPWVLTMDNVVSEVEAKALIELGAVEGYKRSSDVGKLRADGTHEKSVNSGRTSTNAWCQHDCYVDDTAQIVVHRLSNITGIEEPNSEFLQLLKYEPGQFYQVHHDYIGYHIKR